MLDEVRKLVTVTRIRDTKNFTGIWRGVYYDCRAVPDTTSLVVGGVVSCHVVPHSTQLVYIAPNVIAPAFLPIIIWSGSIGSIPVGWALCDGTNGTPDLRDRFIFGATTYYYHLGDTGGSATFNCAHTHILTDYTWPTPNTGYEHPVGGLLHTHPDAEDKYSSAGTNYPGTNTIGFLAGGYSHGIPHTHTISEYPKPAFRDHYHRINGETASALGVETILPQYLAKAYIKALVPADIPTNCVCFSDVEEALFTTGYYYSGNDPDGLTPWLGDYCFVGAGDEATIGGIQLNGTAVGRHTHAFAPTTTDIGSEHAHITRLGSSASSSEGIVTGYGGPPGIWIMSPHWHNATAPAGALTEAEGTHYHDEDVNVASSIGYLEPPYYALNHVVRLGVGPDTLPIGSIVILPPVYELYVYPIWGVWFAYWELDGDIDDVQTTIDVLPGDPGIPTPTPPFIIEDSGGSGFSSYNERMLVTSINSPTSWNVTRGYDGTTPQAQSSGYGYYHDITLDSVPIGWEIRHEFDNCFVPCVGTFVVDETGGNNHWPLPTHVHGPGTLITTYEMSVAPFSQHAHYIDYIFNTASTGIYSWDEYGPHSVGPANWDHTHTINNIQGDLQGVVHTHTFYDLLDSVSDYSESVPNNTTPGQTYGVYFIQKVA